MPVSYVMLNAGTEDFEIFKSILFKNYGVTLFVMCLCVCIKSPQEIWIFRDKNNWKGKVMEGENADKMTVVKMINFQPFW